MKNKVLKKSLWLPGSGQWYAEYKDKGALITVLQIATLGGAIATSLSASKAWSDYNNAEAAYKKAGAGADFNALYSNLEDKHDTASTAGTLQIITIGAVTVVYLYNVIDAMMTEPKVEVKPGFNSLQIEPVIVKEYAGISVSLRF